MNEDEVYATIPADPEQAFLHLEKHFKEVLGAQNERSGEGGAGNVVYVEYISKVLAAITELGLEGSLSSTSVPSIEDVDYQTYLNFSKDVEHLKTQLKIRNARRMQGYTVRLDGATRQKLNHHVQQLRETFQKLEDERKKEALINKLDALQNEIDRDRTRLDALADLTVTVAGVLDTALEPVNKVLNNIARVLYGAQQEELKSLSPPKPTKRLEGPKTPLSGLRKKDGDMDDEIPF
jgi:hypothetical protein